jgi:hypothetical protein
MSPQYPTDPIHQPVYGVPAELRRSLDAALGPQRDWVNAGHAFGGFVISQWPNDEVIEHLYEPLHHLMFYLDELRDDDTNRILALAWLQIRYPDVIEFVPRNHILDFIDGAYKKMFAYGYWGNPHVYNPTEAATRL